MRLATLRPRTQLLLTLLIPAGCLILAVGLVWPYVASLRQVREELQQTQDTIKQKKQSIELAEAAAEGRPLALAVALPTEDEPIAFLRQLAALSAKSGVSLTAVRAIATRQGTTDNVYGTKPAPQTGSPGAPGGPGQRPVVPSLSVQELQDEVTVEGTFANLLTLLVQLENFERILSVSQCRLTSGTSQHYPTLRAVFTLSRFVAAPEPAAAETAPTEAGR